MKKNERNLGGIGWVQNIQPLYFKPLNLTASYNPELHPAYDNYDAIEVSKLKDIPNDYYGVMGVPITYYFKYNPEQFEIVRDMISNAFVKGKNKYYRVLIRRKQ